MHLKVIIQNEQNELKMHIEKLSEIMEKINKKTDDGKTTIKATTHLKRRYWSIDGKYDDVILLKFRSLAKTKQNSLQNKPHNRSLDDSQPLNIVNTSLNNKENTIKTDSAKIKLREKKLTNSENDIINSNTNQIKKMKIKSNNKSINDDLINVFDEYSHNNDSSLFDVNRFLLQASIINSNHQHQHVVNNSNNTSAGKKRIFLKEIENIQSISLNHSKLSNTAKIPLNGSLLPNFNKLKLKKSHHELMRAQSFNTNN